MGKNYDEIAYENGIISLDEYFDSYSNRQRLRNREVSPEDLKVEWRHLVDRKLEEKANQESEYTRLMKYRLGY